MRARSLLVTIVACLCACAPTTGENRSEPRPAVAASPRARANPRVLTREEIVQANVSDSYTLVQRLRPAWLRRRGQDVAWTAADVVVYEDTNRRGYRDALRQISTSGVFQMRYVDPITARTQFGTGHEQGVIVVTTTGTR